MDHNMILILGIGARQGSLALGRPRDETVSIVDTIS
jgi:hypothetical protein